MINIKKEILEQKTLEIKIIQSSQHVDIPEYLKNNEEFFKTILNYKNRGRYLLYASSKIKDNKELVILALKNGAPLHCVSERLRDDEDVVLCGFNKSSNINNSLKDISERLRDSEEIVIEGVKKNYVSLKYISERLKNDEKFMLSVFDIYTGESLQYASKKLQNNFELVLKCIKNSPYALHHASEELKNNKEIVMTAVTEHGLMLEYASEELKNNKELVMTAIRRSGAALQYASNELKNDKEVVELSIKNNIENLKYASLNLQNDRDLLKKLKLNRRIFEIGINDRKDLMQWYRERMSVFSMYEEKDIIQQAMDNNQKDVVRENKRARIKL
jgi:hypothetical protein